jgi:cytochrome P450
MRHVDPHSREFVEQRDALFARLRQEEPVAHSAACGGFWMVTRYDDARRVLEDHGTFSSAFPGRIAVPPTDTSRPPLAPIEVDPPRHSALISLVAHRFGSRAVARTAGPLREEVRRLLAPLAGRDDVEVVAELALPVVSVALALHLDLPLSDADRWIDWAHRIFATRASEPELAQQAGIELAVYVAGLLEERRREPRDDAFTDLATGLVEGAPMTDEEAIGYGIMLLLAGRDASVDALATSLVHLAQHPQDQRRLREAPQDLPRAVEELLRLYTPIGHLARVTTREVQLGDVLLPPDSTVAVVYGSANRDEAVFADADRADLQRRRNSHLAFGAGVHRCLGAQLARGILVTTLQEVLAALPALRPDPERPPVDKLNGDTRGYVSAHLLL